MLSSFSASCFSEMSRTISPRCRSWSETTFLEDASISPRAGTPARSTARNAYVLTLPCSSRSDDRRCAVHGYAATEQPLQLLGHAGPLLRQRSRDLPAAVELGEVGVHRLHSDRSGGLKRRIDLKGLALADQVANRRR